MASLTVPQFTDADKFTKALVSGNKLAAELLKKATALQTKLQMIEQVGCNRVCVWLTTQEDTEIRELNKLAGHSDPVGFALKNCV